MNNINGNSGKNNPRYKDGRTMKKYYCPCGRQLSIYTAKKCKKCYQNTLSGTENPRYKGKIKTICSTCNIHIEIYPFKIKKNKYHYCSQLCRIKSPFNKFRLKDKNHHSWRGGKSICIDCGNRTKSHNVKRCKSCNEHLNKLGKKNPQYIDGKGKEPYSKQWTEKLKLKILNRDNKQCQNCSKTQKQELMDINRNLPIHHIDYNKFNCSEDNLITLCQTCHNKTNINRDFWFAYFMYIMRNR